VYNSLVAGKNAGNFADSAVFCEKPSRKHLRIQEFAEEFHTRASRESIRDSRELILLFVSRQGNERESDPLDATKHLFRAAYDFHVSSTCSWQTPAATP